MESVSVERLDHLGVVASVIKDLGIIEMINARVPPHTQEEITTGEAIAGMIVNGLGFANRPLSLTPQFFANKPLDLLFRPGVRADMFNRFKLGRSLDEVYSYGCDLLFSELALAVCAQEGIEQRFNHLDTTLDRPWSQYFCCMLVANREFARRHPVATKRQQFPVSMMVYQALTRYIPIS